MNDDLDRSLVAAITQLAVHVAGPLTACELAACALARIRSGAVRMRRCGAREPITASRP